MPEDNKSAVSAPPVESMPRTVRAAYALQSAPPAIPVAMTADIATTAARYLPEAVATLADNPPTFASDTRAAIVCTPTLRPRSGGAGRPWSIDFGTPPPALSGVERVLWQEMGSACARAVLWITRYVETRRFGTACELSCASFETVSAWRMASPLFSAVYTAAECAVRSGRLARAEDTLHDLANGDTVKRKQVLTSNDEVVTLVESVPPDTKALSLALAAEAPERYGAGKLGGGAAGVVINLSFSGVAWQPGAVEATVGPAAYDADEAAALTDTEEELG